MIEEMDKKIKEMRDFANMSSQAVFLELALSSNIAQGHITREEFVQICKNLGFIVMTEEEHANLEGAAHFAAMGGGYPEGKA